MCQNPEAVHKQMGEGLKKIVEGMSLIAAVKRPEACQHISRACSISMDQFNAPLAMMVAFANMYADTYQVREFTAEDLVAAMKPLDDAIAAEETRQDAISHN